MYKRRGLRLAGSWPASRPKVNRRGELDFQRSARPQQDGFAARHEHQDQASDSLRSGADGVRATQTAGIDYRVLSPTCCHAFAVRLLRGLFSSFRVA